ncbi:uncharacterized protein LOC143265835 isoform X1 [Megachile rotundata]|uniref:uncharacterized protein LOC143265835 isoform X1 n=1 Tax=Megachile rotundata TaxID=143995 RepID=UPI003FCFAD92
MPTPANCTCVDIVSYCTSTTQNSVILSQSAQEQWDVFRDRLPRSDLIRLPTLISPCGSRMVPTTQEDLGRRRRFAPRIAFPGETTFFEQREERLPLRCSIGRILCRSNVTPARFGQRSLYFRHPTCNERLPLRCSQLSTMEESDQRCSVHLDKLSVFFTISIK